MNINCTKFKEVFSNSGVSVEKLAKASGLTKGRIYQLMWKSGNTNDLSAKALAKVLKVSLDTIRGEG